MNLLKIFLIVMVAELPCMLRTVALHIRSQDNLGDLIGGTILGTIVALGGGFLLAWLLEPGIVLQLTPYLNWIAGIILVALGIYMMMGVE